MAFSERRSEGLILKSVLEIDESSDDIQTKMKFLLKIPIDILNNPKDFHFSDLVLDAHPQLG